MDKYEYKVCLEEIDTLISEGDFARAVEIADTIDWKRVKSVNTLCQISDLYKVNHRFEESRDILLLAYARAKAERNGNCCQCKNTKVFVFHLPKELIIKRGA